MALQLSIEHGPAQLTELLCAPWTDGQWWLAPDVSPGKTLTIQRPFSVTPLHPQPELGPSAPGPAPGRLSSTSLPPFPTALLLQWELTENGHTVEAC